MSPGRAEGATSVPASSDPPHSGEGERASEELAMLRDLLLRPEQDAIEALQHRLDGRTLSPEQVSPILAEAIRARAAENNDLDDALLPTITNGLRQAIERDPKAVADAIYPVIGPAIRRAIAAALREFVANTRQTFDFALAPRSLRWRWQAWRTGRSYSDVVLMHTLVYRVEEVFLIHRETGLAIQHAAAAGTGPRPAALVSAMLTAIEDFVTDSFEADDASLGQLQVGELTVWIEHGPYASLAAVARGVVAEKRLRTRLQETLEQLHRVRAPELRDFAGDASALDDLQPALGDCLISAYRDGP